MACVLRQFQIVHDHAPNTVKQYFWLILQVFVEDRVLHAG